MQAHKGIDMFFKTALQATIVPRWREEDTCIGKVKMMVVRQEAVG